MAGYSGTPIAVKLGIKDGATVALLNAPPGVISDLPPGVVVKTGHAVAQPWSSSS